MTYITVPDMNDSMSSISLDDKDYFLRFTYNEKYDFWNFGLYDADEEPIIAMTRIVPSFSLLGFYTDDRLPNGSFGVLCEQNHVGRDAFNSLKAEFVYIPNDEVED